MRRTAACHRFRLVSGMALVVVACAACGSPVRQTTPVRLIGSPPNAMVTIDDQLVGSLDMVGARGFALPPGRHRLSVEAPGYFPYDEIVETPDGPTRTPVKLDVRLVPIPE